jgi:hypothetical protein
MQPFRVTFTLAALSNAAFGCWAALLGRSRRAAP